jgi:hypothetical protein
MTINRREMLTGAGAAALLSSARLPFAMGGLRKQGMSTRPGDTNPPEKPHNLFASTFTPEVLSKSLISASEWHPYPKASEREAWQQVHKKIADAAIARAEKVRGTAWDSLPATVFLEYKRNGNRSHFEGY